MKRFAIYYIFVLAWSSLWGCGLFNHQDRLSPHPAEAWWAAHVDLPGEWSKQEVAEVIPPEPPKPEQKLFVHSRKGGGAERDRSGGRVYYPHLSAQGYQERGVASWYGLSFHGRKTSSGEMFDMYKISAAHKLLPMHAKVTVTNLENGRSVALTVNDRGPFVAGRVLDLSYAAAKNLGMVDKGLARVLIRTSEPVPGQRNNDIVGEFFIHIGSFESEADAQCLLEDMKSLRYKTSMIKTIRAARDGEIHWRVELGPYKTMSKANGAHAKVVMDYPSAFVVATEQ
ncbi:MAG TPA: septal ring lytic transglycosylase RlpA family protein [Syntrophorhabdales bacterium]|nr:septal ring lytic transglycosylase RlpA family protein [Syntrophorhabdales bacterium]